MHAGRTIGAALAVLVAAAVGMVWLTSPPAAAEQHAGPALREPGQPIERTLSVTASQGAEPAVAADQQGRDGRKTVITRLAQDAPMWAALTAVGPRLGVQIRDVTADDVAKLKLPAQAGAVVEEVTKDSAAEKAGVKAGDVVVQYDGETVRSARQFTRLVRESVPDRTVKVVVLRDGRRVELNAAPAASAEPFGIRIDEEKLRDVEKKLGAAAERLQRFRFERRPPAPDPDSPGGRVFRWRQPAPTPAPGGGMLDWLLQGGGSWMFAPGRGRLGVTVQELTPDLADYFGVKDGLLVNSVQNDSPAARAGIRAGDVIQSVDGKAVTTANQLIGELADKNGDVTIGLMRDRKPLSVRAALEERPPLRRKAVIGKPA
ncbi:MAG TPA: PDZ domain-containing protein [Vicinamibacterales bacterium]|nr:PDZ domain-containing protein [Vicinamibacterales bacterium]HPK71449.1 PDZ domain-containing protein [Vicinamibacterales bacterium]